MMAGHYVSLVKRNKKWYICDDDVIEETSEDKIFYKGAYLLFYRMEMD